MDDLSGGASNAPDEGTIAPSEGASSSIRESLERGFSAVDNPVESSAADGRGADRGDGRDVVGRFAGKGGTAPGEMPVKPSHSEVQAAAEQAGQAPSAPSAPSGPPARFSKAAQEAWAASPPAVQAEVARMEAELTKGLSEYQQRFEPLKRFDEMARAGGTTLDRALEAYVGAENLLRQDPVAGVFQIFKNMGSNRQQVVGILNEAARRLGLTSGGQGGEAAAADPRDAHIARLEQQIQRLGGQVETVGKTLAERDRETKLSAITSEIDAFAQARPRYAELESTIAELLESRYAKNLEDAYEKAEKLHPLPPAPAAAAVPQTRKASLTITGSPASGSNPDSRKSSGSSREALANAFAQVGLG
jgi:hypothetical protein